MDTAQLKKKLVRFMEEHRGLIVVLFCLPASFIFDLCFQLRNWFYRTVLSAPQKHDERVRAIQAKVSFNLYTSSIRRLLRGIQVREWNNLPEAGRKPMCTARANWLSLSTKFFRKVPLYSCKYT